VGANVVGDLPREVAVIVENQLEAVHHDGDKLDHLQSRHVLLPPDVLLVLRTQGSHEVVEIHEHVHKSVAEPKEGCVASRNPPGSRLQGFFSMVKLKVYINIFIYELHSYIQGFCKKKNALDLPRLREA